MTLKSTHHFLHLVRYVILCVMLLGILGMSLSFKAHASSVVPSSIIATGETSNFSPALSPSPDSSRLYLGWTGTDGHVNITFKNSSDASFPQQNKITLADTATSAPSMATFKNQLYVAYRGTDSGGPGGNLGGLGIYTGAQSLQQFSVIHTTAGNVTTPVREPAIVSTNGTLYVAWISGTAFNTTLHISSSNKPQPSATFMDHTIMNVSGSDSIRINSPVALTISHGAIFVTYTDANFTSIEQGQYSLLGNPNALSGLTTLPPGQPDMLLQSLGGPATTANGTGVIWLAFPTLLFDTLCTTTSPSYQGCTIQDTSVMETSPALGSSFGGQVFLAWLSDFTINFCQLSTLPGGTCM